MTNIKARCLHAAGDELGEAPNHDLQQTLEGPGLPKRHPPQAQLTQSHPRAPPAQGMVMQMKTQPELAGCTGAAVRVLRGKMSLLEMWPQIWWSPFALSQLQAGGLGRSILLKTATTSQGGAIKEGKRRTLCEH